MRIGTAVRYTVFMRSESEFITLVSRFVRLSSRWPPRGYHHWQPRTALRCESRFTDRRHLRIHRLPRGTQRRARRAAERLATASRAGALSVPFVSIGAGGTLERHVLDRANSWPLRSHLASVALVEDRVLELRTRGRLEQRREATDLLLRELQRVTRDHHSRLLVAILESRDEPKRHVMAFTAREGIEAVDCTVPNQEELQVPGYSHPDRRINAEWARCIGERLGRL